jgi:carboxymethylenebutenolidase
MQTTFLSGGRTIRLNVTEPATPGPHPAILLLHGAGGNVDFWLDRISPFIERLGIAIYAVHYFDRTGTIRADLPTLSDGVHVPLWIDTLRDTLAHLRTRAAVNPQRIALIGISLGAFLSLALAAEASASQATVARCIVDISGGLVRPYSERATSAFPPTLILHGDADTVVGLYHAENLQTLLKQLDVSHEAQILPEEGHYFSPAAQTRILIAIAAFLKRHLV